MFVVTSINRCLGSHGGFTEHVPAQNMVNFLGFSTVDNPRYRSVYPGKGVLGYCGTMVTSS